MSSNWRTRDGQKQRNVYKKYKKRTLNDFVYNTKCEQKKFVQNCVTIFK